MNAAQHRRAAKELLDGIDWSTQSPDEIAAVSAQAQAQAALASAITQQEMYDLATGDGGIQIMSVGGP